MELTEKETKDNHENSFNTCDAAKLVDAYFEFVFTSHFGACGKEDRYFLAEELLSLINRATLTENDKPSPVSESIFSALPDIQKQLFDDALYIFASDPAADSVDEVISAYPGFYATAVYRLAHLFYLERLKISARIISEIAHSRAGIDIHPGAKIGSPFAIDHGNGIVIGESAEIGNNVSLYHGVTLGAKRSVLDENGKIIKIGKRHPTIGNNCIICANATILGGDTVVGDNCIIGANVMITHSIDPGKIISINQK